MRYGNVRRACFSPVYIIIKIPVKQSHPLSFFYASRGDARVLVRPLLAVRLSIPHGRF
jgi:hypothetical protein